MGHTLLCYYCGHTRQLCYDMVSATKWQRKVALVREATKEKKMVSRMDRKATKEKKNGE